MICSTAHILALMLASAALAQEISPEASGGAEARSQEDPPKSLDELLGLEDAQTQREGERELPLTDDPTRTELDRRLEGEQISEAFVEAVSLMGETAQRLDAGRDTGITTQRLQEEIIRKLDQVLESAQQSQSQSSSSSSDSPQQQPDQQQQQQSNDPQNSDSNDTREAPAERDGQLSPQGAGNSAAWGALRARVRDSLIQGTNDPFSSLYRSLTEDFYRRLAEEDGR